MTATVSTAAPLSSAGSRQRQRDPSLDLVRITAFFSVISVHFFLNCGFYQIPVRGLPMYAAVLVRTFFMDCVPLFLILSGYLLNRKALSRHYYRGIVPILCTYLLASLCCLLYAGTRRSLSPKSAAASLLDFTAAPYGWYIEMYLGLFLAIPFLNVCYHALPSKKQKQILLLTAAAITALPPVVNSSFQILPAWWVNFYPITYYFLGAYLREYPPRIKSRYLVGLLLLHIAVFGSYNYYMSYGQKFIWGSWTGWGSMQNVITAALVFLLIRNIPTQTWSPRRCAVIGSLSELCLGGYLLSWIFDTLCYPVLLSSVPSTVDRFPYLPVMVLAVGSGSLVLSRVVTTAGTRIAALLPKG